MSIHTIAKRVGRGTRIASRVTQKALKVGKRVAHGASAVAAIAGRPDVSVALHAAGDGMGELGGVIHGVHKNVKSDLEKQSK